MKIKYPNYALDAQFKVEPSSNSADRINLKKLMALFKQDSKNVNEKVDFLFDL
jgi:hypothetical protein